MALLFLKESINTIFYTMKALWSSLSFRSKATIFHGKPSSRNLFQHQSQGLLRDGNLSFRTREESTVNMMDSLASDSVTSFEFAENHQSVLQLFQGTADGNTARVSQLLDLYPNRINVPNSQGDYLIHLAVMNHRPAILALLLSKGADVNVVDAGEKTALHYAVMEQSLEMINMLLSKDADPHVRDVHKRMPLHTAAEVGNVVTLERLLPYYPDIDIQGEGGYTALHYAACRDCADAVRLLIREKCLITRISETGDFPIHLAAKSGSAKAIQAIVEESPSQGYSQELVMLLRDREHNRPIHAAVNGGSAQAVKYCLQSGSSLICKQGDGSTPLHFAAAQGDIDIVKCMYDTNTSQFCSALSIMDGMHRTPLHWATMFNHLTVMKYLLDKGSDVNALDGKQLSPLLLAASKGNWEATKLLLSCSANVNFRDRLNHNYFHLLILSNEIIHDMPRTLKSMTKLQQCIDEKDCFGCTPLHYAARAGNLPAVADLLSMGASLFTKDFQKHSPFHYAAMYGRIGTCKLMLETSSASSLKNAPGSTGLTPLHLAAENGHIKIVSMLLQRGAVVGKDLKDNTPLHLAALSGRVECVKVLLNLHSNLIDYINNTGDTALHFAAANGHTECVCLLLSHDAKIIQNYESYCFFDEVIKRRHSETAAAIVAHERWREVMSYQSTVYGSFLIGAIQKLPNVCVTILDQCVEVVEKKNSSADEFFIRYNFEYLNMPRDFERFTNMSKVTDKALYPLQEMVRFNLIECLSHPLCVNYLRMKWQKYGWFVHFFDSGLYLLFLACITVFVVMNDSGRHTDIQWPFQDFANFVRQDTHNTTFMGPNVDHHRYSHSEINFHIFPTYMRIMQMYIVVYSGLNILKEVYRIIRQNVYYLIHPTNLMVWLQHGSTLLFIVPFLFGYSTHIQWTASAVAIFFAWFYCLVSLQRFDLFGLYVVMFLEIMKTLVHVVLVFSILNIAFGLAFYVLMAGEKNKANSTPILSIYRTLILLLEIDFINTFNKAFQDDDDQSLHFGVLTYILLAIFILLMPILLINLLIGLAVGDIEAVQRSAELKRLSTQVRFHAAIESRLGFLQTFSTPVLEIHPKTKWKTSNELYYKQKKSSVEPLTQSSRRERQSEDSGHLIMRGLREQRLLLKEAHVDINKNQSLMVTVLSRFTDSIDENLWDEGDPTLTAHPPHDERVAGFQLGRE